MFNNEQEMYGSPDKSNHLNQVYVSMEWGRNIAGMLSRPCRWLIIVVLKFRPYNKTMF